MSTHIEHCVPYGGGASPINTGYLNIKKFKLKSIIDIAYQTIPVSKSGYRPLCRVGLDGCTMSHPKGSVVPRCSHEFENVGEYTPFHMKDRDADLQFLHAVVGALLLGSGDTTKTTHLTGICQQNSFPMTVGSPQFGNKKQE
jgi:hypothetical protein